MGYDMYLVDEPTEDEALLVKQAKGAWDLAVEARDRLPPGSAEYEAAQQRAIATYELLDEAEANYYRLNIWGMQATRLVMWNLGMLKDGVNEGSWPDPPPSIEEDDVRYLLEEAGTEADQPAWRAAHPDVTDQQIADYRQWDADSEKHKALHDPDTPGIGANKFSSNDGWLVTPFECLGAVGMWDRATREQQDAALLPVTTQGEAPDEVRAWFEAWVNWLRLAQHRGGFRVY